MCVDASTKRTYLKVGASFAGWETLAHIVNQAVGIRDKLLILTLFKTGGRVSEVLELTKSNIDLNASPHSVIIKDMRILKKFKRIGGQVQNIPTFRTIPILTEEPLTLKWINFLRRIRSKLLFPGRHYNKPMTRINAYYIVTEAGRRAGVQVSDHWFRGQRASQLAQEYLFDEFSLNQYFGWARDPAKMSQRYAALNWRGLEEKMLYGFNRLQGRSPQGT